MFMEKVEKGKPIDRDEFERRLARWIESGDVLTTVGDSPTYGGAAWIHVAHEGDLHYLNADSTAEGVREYLRRLSSDPQLPWTVGENRRGGRNKVLFGEPPRTIPGFYLYVGERR